MAKLREVAQIAAKLVDAWGPDNVDYATIWLAHGEKMDDLEEFIKKYAKDPEKAFQYLEELRQVMHKYIKPKGLRPPTSDPETEKTIKGLLREIEELKREQTALRREIEELKRMLEELISMLKTS